MSFLQEHRNKLKHFQHLEQIYRNNRDSCELIESDEFNKCIERIKFLQQLKSNMIDPRISHNNIDKSIYDEQTKSYSFQPEWSRHNDKLQQCKKDIGLTIRIIRTNEKTMNTMRNRHLARTQVG